MRASFVAGLCEFGSRLLQYPRPATVPLRAADATISANPFLLEAVVHALYWIVLLVVLGVPLSILITAWTVARTVKARFVQFVQRANAKMEEAINDALAGRSLLLERLEAANSKVAREIVGLEKLVEAERTRVCAAAKEILEKELVSFRMFLESCVTGHIRELQQQFDQQAARVKVSWPCWRQSAWKSRTSRHSRRTSRASKTRSSAHRTGSATSSVKSMRS